jgi:hypothetical protein
MMKARSPEPCTLLTRRIIPLPVHKAQTLTYLRLSNCPIALLMNFNTVLLRDGLHRLIP